MHQLDYAYLQTAGLPVGSLDPRTFRMFYMGQEIAIQVLGQADGVFDPTDAILFYGRSVDSLYYEGLLPTNKYTGTNVYWLTYGGANGLRMNLKDGSVAGSVPGPFLTTVHLERSRYYFSAIPFLQNADHWYGERFQAFPGTAVTTTYTFVANNVASGPVTPTLTAYMMGNYSTSRHHIKFYFNSVLVLDDNTSWSSYSIFTPTMTLPQAAFREGSNTIQVVLLTDPGTTFDEVYTNWLEVRYNANTVAVGNALQFRNDTAGMWSYQVSNFSTSDVEVYDISDLFAVQRFVSTTVTGAVTYTVNFGDTVIDHSRYLALTAAKRIKPAASAITQVTHLTSGFTPTDLLAGTNQADYIIVTHANFWSQAQRLATHRAGRLPGGPGGCAGDLQSVQRRDDVGRSHPRFPGLRAHQLAGARADVRGSAGRRHIRYAQLQGQQRADLSAALPLPGRPGSGRNRRGQSLRDLYAGQRHAEHAHRTAAGEHSRRRQGDGGQDHQLRDGLFMWELELQHPLCHR